MESRADRISKALDFIRGLIVELRGIQEEAQKLEMHLNQLEDRLVNQEVRFCFPQKILCF
jgi:hypothetical protein